MKNLIIFFIAITSIFSFAVDVRPELLVCCFAQSADKSVDSGKVGKCVKAKAKNKEATEKSARISKKKAKVVSNAIDVEIYNGQLSLSVKDRLVKCKLICEVGSEKSAGKLRELAKGEEVEKALKAEFDSISLIDLYSTDSKRDLAKAVKKSLSTLIGDKKAIRQSYFSEFSIN